MPDDFPGTEHPLVLLPVRLETRFFGTELRVRVYPDTIHVDTHEPQLTADEVQWARHYHEMVWRAAGDNARGQRAWRQVAERFGPERAAWIVRVLAPENANARPTTAVPDDQPLAVAPVFPAGPQASLAAGSWTRAPLARLLPDRWTATAFIGGSAVATTTGRDIQDPLPVGPHPDALAPDDPAAVPADEGMRWMIDFDEAERAGMALRLSIPAPASGQSLVVERLIVSGVSATDAQKTSSLLGELLHAHLYTGGIGLLPQGTPTNNTSDMRSAFDSDARTDAMGRVALGGALFAEGDGSDGDRLRATLGVEAHALAWVTGADAREQVGAAHMGRALWPSTGGYYLEQMLHGLFAAADADAHVRWTRGHFVEHVRAAGPLPTLRVGRQPYGLLPVTALDAWAPSAEEEDAARSLALVVFLREQVRHWQGLTGLAPRIGRTNDPDKDFIDVFTTDGVSTSYAARNAMGEQYARHLLGLLGMPIVPGTGDSTHPTWNARHLNFATAAARQAGLAPAAASSPLGMALHMAQATPLDHVPVVPAAAEDNAAPFNVAAHLRDAPTIAAVVGHAGVPTPRSLLYTILRQGLLLEYASAAARALQLAPGQRLEPEHVGFDQLGAFETPLGRILRAGLAEGTAFTEPSDVDVQEFRKSLAHLATMGSQGLDLILRATLDLWSHRLDAWITSIATRRLAEMRRRTPGGVRVGGYGWLEQIQAAAPATPAPTPAGETGPVGLLADNPGFVHAASLDQAATIAVLRSGHLSHSSTDKRDLLAIDLSSARARLAQWILDGVRAGQPLGALLGYRLERALHEHHPQLPLDRFIAPLRDLAPLTAVRVDHEGVAVETVPAGNVIDGLALSRRRKATAGFPFDVLDVTPPITAAERAALEREFQGIDETIDAVSDAVLAESVHQVVRGNPSRAAATLDALERGEAPPPELDVLRAPRSGSAFTHRTIIVCQDGGVGPGWTPTSRRRPRAAAEPLLNAWLERLLPAPSSVRCRVVGEPRSASEPAPVHEFPLSALDLSALDILHDASSGVLDASSPLVQRIVDAARDSHPPLATGALTLVPARDAAWTFDVVSLAELSEIAHATKLLVTRARPLEASDVAPEPDDSVNLDIDDLLARGDAATSALRDAVDALREVLAEETVNRRALRDACAALADFGVPGANAPLPADDTADEDLALVAQARAVDHAVSARLVRVEEDERAAGDPATSERERATHLARRVRGVFGDEFMILPRFVAANAADIASSLEASDALQDGDPFAAVEFHQRMARVRAPLARFDDALRLSEALRTGTGMTLGVAQLPHAPGDRWVGLPHRADVEASRGRLSLMVHLALGFDASRPMSGLFIDEWIDVVPAARETTGVVFQYNQPDACPPHAILIAVPPNPKEQPAWTSTALEQVVGETLDLARIRSVGPAQLGEFSQYLPALYFALNARNDTISADFLNPGD